MCDPNLINMFDVRCVVWLVVEACVCKKADKCSLNKVSYLLKCYFTHVRDTRYGEQIAPGRR